MLISMPYLNLYMSVHSYFVLQWTTVKGEPIRNIWVSPFKLSKVQFYIGYRHLRATDNPLSAICWSIFVSLSFSDHKTWCSGIPSVVNYPSNPTRAPSSSSSHEGNSCASTAPTHIHPCAPSNWYNAGVVSPAPVAWIWSRSLSQPGGVTWPIGQNNVFQVTLIRGINVSPTL